MSSSLQSCHRQVRQVRQYTLRHQSSHLMPRRARCIVSKLILERTKQESKRCQRLHIALQTALRDGPATETGVSPSAGVDSDPLGEAAQVHVAPFLSAPEESLPGACLALLPVPSATPLQPEITRESCSNDVTGWNLSKGTPVCHFEQDGYTVISTKSQWAVQAILLLLSGCYLQYGYRSHAFLSPPGGPWYYHVQGPWCETLGFPKVERRIPVTQLGPGWDIVKAMPASRVLPSPPRLCWDPGALATVESQAMREDRQERRRRHSRPHQVPRRRLRNIHGQ